MEKDMQILSDRILAIINELDLNQSEFARIIGVSFTYVNLIINNKRHKISCLMAHLIQEKYGYSADWILTGKGNMRDMSIYNYIIDTVSRLPMNEIKLVLDYIFRLEQRQKEDGNRKPKGPATLSV
jgi:transcriptional regulator with XRE-family HTH domain